jgi:hypothetical protein
LPCHIYFRPDAGWGAGLFYTAVVVANSGEPFKDIGVGPL